MRKITRSYTPTSQNEGGPVRKLAAAARAVMEPVEHRVMMSASPATLVNQQINSITAKAATQPVAHAGAAASDSAIWVNPSDPSKSAIIGTDAKGAINVYDLSGNLISSNTTNAYANVDLRSNFSLGGKSVTLVTATNVTKNKLTVFTLDPSTRTLTYVEANSIIPSVSGKVTGLTMYQSSETGKTYAFVATDTGAVQEFELSDNGQGKVVGTSVRTFQVGSDVEGMVADDDTGALYVSETNVGIWKYGAEPTDGAVRVQVDSVGSGGHLASADGLAIYKTNSGGGYLIAADQAGSDYVVYDRTTGAYVTQFAVKESNGSGLTSSTGISVTNASLGSALPEGTLVLQDSNTTTGHQDFKIVSWGDIARAQSVPLAIDSSQGAVSTPVVSSDSTSTSNSSLNVTSLTLYKANSTVKLATIANGSTIDLADYPGLSLNIHAGVQGTVGSVKFSVNGNSNYHTENYASYEIAGANGAWTPTVGTYTITATGYSARWGTGTAGASYTVTFTVVDSSKTTTTKPSSTKTSTPTKTSKPTSTSTSTATTTPESTVPDAATNVTATAGSNQITVKWSGDSSATGYNVERSTDGKTFTKVATTTSTSYVDSAATAGTTYTYRVTAFNDTGSSASSVTASATIAKPVVASTPVTSDPVAPANRPSASTTGVKAGTKLTTVNDLKATSNTTYSNLYINGQVSLMGLTNVTFINCVIDGNSTSPYGIRCDGATGIVIQNCEIKNVASAGIFGGGFTAINNYIHQSSGDGIKPTEDAVIEGNYICDLGWNSPNAHADGVQVTNANNIKIIGNFFDEPKNVANTRANSAMFLTGTSSNVVFENNWVVGGNYAIHAYSDTAGANPTIKITNNTFYTGSVSFGFGTTGTGVVWSSNVTDTGVVATSSMH